MAGDTTRAPLDVRLRTRWLTSVGRPSRPLAGHLPLRRLVPQDLHSLVDYAGSAALGLGAVLANDARAQHASVGFMLFGLVASAFTDYRISLCRLIPIEVHEVLDLALGVAVMAAPFVLGYVQTSATVAVLHVAGGALLVAEALLTDYRAYRRH